MMIFRSSHNFFMRKFFVEKTYNELASNGVFVTSKKTLLLINRPALKKSLYIQA